MSATAIRLKKEARALAWPWCAIVICGALPVMLRHAFAEAVNAVMISLGIPLLATLPLGNEFEQRTISLWLTQPLGRRQLWAEKTGVLCAAVLSAALASGIGAFHSSWSQGDFSPAFWYSLYVIAIMCSATFWTLVARSTIGALFLNGCAQGLIFWVVLSIRARTLDLESGLEFLEKNYGRTWLAVVVVLYSALMLWLGERKLERFQLKGENAGDDLAMAGPSFLPQAWARWFQCRPSGALLNLIRKELRLLRPLWLMTAVGVLGLVCMALLKLWPGTSRLSGTTGTLQILMGGMLVVLFFMLAIVAGNLSMGEERTWGTHAAQMTLPVSLRRQWLVKIAVAAASGVVCACLVPLLVSLSVGWVHESALEYVNTRELPFWMLAVLLASLASFWCACTVNGTARASLLFFPAVLAISYAAWGGLWLGQKLTPEMMVTARDLVVSWLHLNPLAFQIRTNYSTPPDWFYFFLLLVPGISWGVMQSYKLYRSQVQENALWVMRCLLPPVAASLVCGLLTPATFYSSRWQPIAETWHAVDKLQPGARKLEVSGEDLARDTGVSPLTRRWLAGSRISAAPPGDTHSLAYRTTIQLASGLECTMIVAPGTGLTQYGGSAVFCGNPNR